ncbi:hypothetical protein LINPERPRIM_LOCUS29515, partial [Linum perenne]
MVVAIARVRFSRSRFLGFKFADAIAATADVTGIVFCSVALVLCFLCVSCVFLIEVVICCSVSFPKPRIPVITCNLHI